MKSIINIALLLTMGLSISAFGAPLSDLSPIEQKGGITPMSYAGASTCVISNSTGTNAVLCDTGAGIVLDIHTSSITSTSQLVMRDSATANTTSTVLDAVDASARPVLVYPRYKNGLSVNVTPAADAGTGRWTIIYKPLD